MNNHERYQRAFEPVQTTAKIELEKANMKPRMILKPAFAALALAVCIPVGAYAADAGGIRTTIHAWISGNETDAEVTEVEPGTYEYSYEKDGETIFGGGGGISYNEDGTETPISAEEFMELNASGTETVDGRIYLYDHELKFDITDLFDANGICRVVMTRNGTATWYEVERDARGNISYSTLLQAPANAQEYTALN